MAGLFTGVGFILLIFVSGILTATGWTAAAGSAIFDITATPVTTVSAASFESTPVAPGSIVAAFGVQLATQTVVASDADPGTPGVQLPTSLGGTTVEVNGIAAGLFFVSPGQVNYVVPPGTASGLATVVVHAGDGTTSNGSVSVAQVAPAVFTANANGQGVIAAALLRVKMDGTQIYEPVSSFNQTLGRFVTLPIDMGPEGERVFLILFLSGIRGANDPNGDGNLDENIRVLAGGTELTPLYAGVQPDFVGLDQINVEIPRSLTGSGLINVSVSATGFNSSNLSDLEVAGIQGGAPPLVNGFGAPSALAGQQLVINGSGFSANPAENQVRISGVDADVMSSSASQITVMVPFGAATGTVTVKTSMGEDVSDAILPVRTSISGFVENTDRQPMVGMTVRIPNTALSTVTNEDGAFVLADVPPGAQFVEFDGNSLQMNPPYPKVTLKTVVHSDQDNLFSHPIAMQQATGSGGTVGGGSSADDGEMGIGLGAGFRVAGLGQNPLPVTIQTGNFILDVPENSQALFPSGATVGMIFLTPLQNGRTPIDLPFGYYSSSIVQITPFNVKLDPGARLIFPNDDNFPAGTDAVLFRFDPQEGRFIQDSARARVSDDGMRIETEPGAIKTTNFYFAAIQRQTTTIVGRVLRQDGITPVTRAVVRFRGREAFTDGAGSFVLRFVPIIDKEPISVEVSYLRPSGRVERVQSSSVPAVQGGVTRIPDVILPGEKDNRPPTVLAALKFQINEGVMTDIPIQVSDPDRDQNIAVKVEGPQWVSIIKGQAPLAPAYLLRCNPGYSDSGIYPVAIVATDSQGAETRHQISLIVLDVNRPPQLTVPGAQTITEAQTLTFGISATDPDQGQGLTLSMAGTPPQGASLSQNGNSAQFTWKPNVGQTGSFTIAFKVTDNGNPAMEDTKNVVIYVNPRQLLIVPDSRTVNEGQSLLFSAALELAEDYQYFDLTAVGLPTGASLSNQTQQGREFRWTPNFIQAGDHTVRFNVVIKGTSQIVRSADIHIRVFDVRHDLMIDPAQLTIFGASGEPAQTEGDLGDRLGRSVATGDINNDGIPDLVVGSVNSNVPAVDAGSVFVFFGHEGLKGEIDLAQKQADITFHGAAAGDGFGSSLAIGDINGDGKNDLIIGAPGADVGDFPDAGKVYALWGGLAPGTYEIGKSANLVINGTERSGMLGASVATGFFRTKKGQSQDLIAGAPGVDNMIPGVPVALDAGTIYGFYGSEKLAQIMSAEKSDFRLEGLSPGSRLGETLAGGDFNNDGYDDFAAGAPAFEKTRGAVYFVFGRENIGSLLTSEVPALKGPDQSDRFGIALAMADLTGDAMDELVIGAPYGGGPDNQRLLSGEIHIFYGANFLESRPADTVIYYQPSRAGIPVFFGANLGLGDFNGDGANDLAIAAPGEDSDDLKRQLTGRIYLLFGKNDKHPAVVDFSEARADLIVYGADSGDILGAGGIALANINNMDAADLIMGIPAAWSLDNKRKEAGEVRVLWGVKR